MTRRGTKTSRALRDGDMVCVTCRMTKLLSEFWFSPTTGIPHSACKKCDSEYFKAWKRKARMRVAELLVKEEASKVCCEGCNVSIDPATPMTRGGLLCLPCRVAFIATKIPAAGLPQGSADRPVSLSVSSPKTPPLRAIVEGLFVEGSQSLHPL